MGIQENSGAVDQRLGGEELSTFRFGLFTGLILLVPSIGKHSGSQKTEKPKARNILT